MRYIGAEDPDEMVQEAARRRTQRWVQLSLMSNRDLQRLHRKKRRAAGLVPEILPDAKLIIEIMDLELEHGV